MAKRARPGKVNHSPVPEIEGNPIRNELLLGLPSAECNFIFPQLTFLQLHTHDVLEEVEEPIKYAYFIDSGLVSVPLHDAKRKECGSWDIGQGGLHRITACGGAQNEYWAVNRSG